jgi:hypothetical protein
VSLSGSRVAGGSGAGANSIFLGDFDFVKLGIGGLDAEFNKIFRRAFASRIWPAHIIKQMGITHVRGMLVSGDSFMCHDHYLQHKLGPRYLHSRSCFILRCFMFFYNW